ncbi:MAG: hypothetical protein OXM61_16665 [Candidatus Poribacteria bacterium]|nr:hypothetical protein [Candidatus Poribacteria bacterium]
MKHLGNALERLNLNEPKSPLFNENNQGILFLMENQDEKLCIPFEKKDFIVHKYNSDTEEIEWVCLCIFGGSELDYLVDDAFTTQILVVEKIFVEYPGFKRITLDKPELREVTKTVNCNILEPHRIVRFFVEPKNIDVEKIA